MKVVACHTLPIYLTKHDNEVQCIFTVDEFIFTIFLSEMFKHINMLLHVKWLLMKLLSLCTPKYMTSYHCGEKCVNSFSVVIMLDCKGLLCFCSPRRQITACDMQWYGFGCHVIVTAAGN